MAPSPIYIALAVVYFAGLILVGIWSTRRGGDSNQYLNATSSLPLWVCATACIAANCGSLDLFAMMALAAQYGKDNISFVAVNPGPVRTERWAGLVDAMTRDMKIPREEADTLAPRSIPLGRIAECEEVASLVTYLASDLAHFVNGTMIEIDGGQLKPLMDRFRDR